MVADMYIYAEGNLVACPDKEVMLGYIFSRYMTISDIPQNYYEVVPLITEDENISLAMFIAYENQLLEVNMENKKCQIAFDILENYLYDEKHTLYHENSYNNGFKENNSYSPCFLMLCSLINTSKNLTTKSVVKKYNRLFKSKFVYKR